MEAASTAAVEITSLRASAAVARSVSESIKTPILWLNRLIHSLTAMDATNTPADNQPKLTGVGCSTLSALSLSSSMPMTRIMTETARPARYSYRAWPKGCFSSAGRAPSRNPARLTMLELASDKLFMASAVMATLPNSVPTRNLPANSSTLQTIPVIQARLA